MIDANLKKNFFKLKDNIQIAENKYDRSPGSVKLLAVSKGHAIEKIASLVACGQRSFGESFVQEALPKIAYFTQPSNSYDANSVNSDTPLASARFLEWHFIGTIQRNKTRKIAEHFDWVQSVSDKMTAKRLSDQRPINLDPLNICLEINIENETTKSGATIEEINDLADYCSRLPNLNLRGIMAIPSLQTDFQSQRNKFKQIKQVYDMLCRKGFQLDTLSIGMSDDMEAAIAEGSTLIRIGTAIFGSRKKDR